MKNKVFNSTISSAILVLFISFASISPSPGQQKKSATQILYREGVQLFEQDRFAEAAVKFEAVLKRSPQSLYARSYLGKCKAGIAQGSGAKDALKSELEKIKIPSIAFADAPIGDVMDYLSQRATELSDDKVALNFIYKGTPEQRKNTLITLNLKNVPMTEAIRYIGQLTRTTFKYEEHAVIVDPNGRTTTAQAPAPEKKSNNRPFGNPPKKDPFGN